MPNNLCPECAAKPERPHQVGKERICWHVLMAMPDTELAVIFPAAKQVFRDVETKLRQRRADELISKDTTQREEASLHG